MHQTNFKLTNNSLKKNIIQSEFNYYMM